MATVGRDQSKQLSDLRHGASVVPPAEASFPANLALHTVAAKPAATDTAVWERRTVARLQAGDDAALREAYDAYGGFVLALARRVTASNTLAEDITQEVFIQLWTNVQRVDLSIGSLRSYLGVLTHRRAVDLVRAEQSRKTHEERDSHVQAPPGPSDLGEHAADVAQAEIVRAALELLPAEQRQIVIMTYLYGQSYRDVARELGIPEGTAKSRGRLALQKLAGALAAQGITASS